MLLWHWIDGLGFGAEEGFCILQNVAEEFGIHIVLMGSVFDEDMCL